jgi:hypothetical protein
VKPLDFVIAVDGSLSTIPNTLAPHKTLSYIKIAALNISLEELEKAQAPIVNPDMVHQLLSTHADTESTVLPLGNIRVPGKTLLESERQAIETTFKKFQGGSLYETLRYLVSQEWDPDPAAWQPGAAERPHFRCPFCSSDVTFPRSQFAFACSACGRDLSLCDYMGLLMEVNETSNDASIAFNLMSVLEHLLLFTYVRVLVEKGPRFHERVLLLKDGPLMLRGQYSRLVDPIRAYLHHLERNGKQLFIAGVEKDGAFAEHIEEIKHWFGGGGKFFLPDNRYILERIKHSGSAATQYGEKVLYGSKLYYAVNQRNILVLNVPHYAANAKPSDLPALNRIAKTLDCLVSRQYQNALLPIVAVNRIASMSFYPSNNILERFTEAELAARR